MTREKLCFVRDWGRPMGVEPTIFLREDSATIPFAEEQQFYPSIISFDTEFEAIQFILKNCPHQNINYKE